MNSEVVDVLGEDGLTGVLVRDVRTGEEQKAGDPRSLPGNRTPAHTESVQGIITMESCWLIVPTRYDDHIAGVLRGRCDDHRYRQQWTAARDGCRAAIDVERWLESSGRGSRRRNWIEHCTLERKAPRLRRWSFFFGF